MANLLDTIRGNAPVQQQGVTDETQKLQGLLRAKSGKALDTSGGVATSNLGEQAAVSQANQQIQNEIIPQQQLQVQGQMQQARGQEQQFQQQSQQIGQQKRFDDLRTQLQVDSILKDLERNKGKIDMDTETANVAQVAQTLRLQNQQYIDNLQREGQRARLDNDLSFKEQFQRALFADNQDLLKNQQANQAILSADQREFNKMIGDMEMSSAYNAFRSDLANARTAAVVGGLSSFAQAGATAYGSRDKTPTSANDSDAGDTTYISNR